MKPYLKMIIPLLGWNLKLEDVDKSKGFRGVFSYDINRPSLDKHIFLFTAVQRKILEHDLN